MMQPMEEIYKSYAMTVYKYLLSMTHDEDLSEELTQETFYQLSGRSTVTTRAAGSPPGYAVSPRTFLSHTGAKTDNTTN